MSGQITQGNTLTKKDGVAEIEFSYPPHNSLTLAGLMDLSAKIDEVSADEGIRAVIIKSTGARTFCAGANFDELAAVSTMEEAVLFFGGFASLFYSMALCEKPILCRVQGKAVGGALGIIASSDLCYATTHAQIKLSELNVGIGPFVVGPPIENKIGRGNLQKLAFNPNVFYSAEWTMARGMYTEVFGCIEEADEKIAEKTQELINFNPAAVKQIKSILKPDLLAFKELLDYRKQLSAGLLLSDFTRNRLKKLTK